MPLVEIGDQVLYTPHVCHALDRNQLGKYAWAANVVPEKIRSTPREAIRWLHPQTRWPATVRGVNEDGSLDLDIQNLTMPGVTLHYDKIKHATLESNQGHTWCEIDSNA